MKLTKGNKINEVCEMSAGSNPTKILKQVCIYAYTFHLYTLAGLVG